MGDCHGEGMYCGQESPSSSRPDSASGRGHPCCSQRDLYITNLFTTVYFDSTMEDEYEEP